MAGRAYTLCGTGNGWPGAGAGAGVNPLAVVRFTEQYCSVSSIQQYCSFYSTHSTVHAVPYTKKDRNIKSKLSSCNTNYSQSVLLRLF